MKLKDVFDDVGSWTRTFCGRLSDSQTYMTSSRNLALYASPSTETDHLNAYFDVLSADALRKRYSEMRNDNKSQTQAVADSR